MNKQRRTYQLPSTLHQPPNITMLAPTRKGKKNIVPFTNLHHPSILLQSQTPQPHHNSRKALSAATTNNTPQPPHLSLVEKHTNIYIKLHNNTLLQQVPRLHLDVFRIHSTGFIIKSERIKNHFFLAQLQPLPPVDLHLFKDFVTL